VAVTPAGSYRFTWRYSGWRTSDLGELYNPVYFHGGIAVHGAPSVPNYPASHGCVRIPMHIAEYFPSLVAKGDPVYVVG
jgi:lipoprotein-anchoring transpeptidase ErfK/SrfK